tara:strand:- start:1285 stop:2049 length:765 start_codon:yes stop_codon:yes gene_type:complete
MSENKVVNNTDNCSNTENNTSNKSDNSNQSITSQFTVYNLATGAIFKSNACNRITDSILIVFSIGGLGFGILAWFTISNITAIGYILSGVFSSISLFSIKRMRLRASLQSSVNVLKEENDELKENNEELQENIDELEVVSKTLNDDIKMLENTIGIFGKDAEEIINNLREIYQNLKKENEVQAKLNRNSIYLHILHIIKHFDRNCNFTMSKENLEKAKKTLINAFPNLDYESLHEKINKNNKITAQKILESVKL